MEHARSLNEKIEQVYEAASKLISVRDARGFSEKGVMISFDVAAFEGFNPRSFEHASHGPYLLSFKEHDGRGIASVYVQRAEKFDFYRRKIAKYESSGEGELLLAATEDVRLSNLRDIWTDLSEAEPPTDGSRRWWEVWLRDDEEWQTVRFKLQRAELEVSERFLRFPGRFVTTVAATSQQLEAAIGMTPAFAEVRSVPPIGIEIVEASNREQQDRARNLANRARVDKNSNSRVCVLDTGVDGGHPLLEGLLAEGGVWAYRPHWRGDPHGHGTQMAGLCSYGLELEDAVGTNEPVEVRHLLEVAAIMREGEPNPEDTWGVVTQSAVDAMESLAPTANRVFNLSVGGPKSHEGAPSAWSAAIDQLAAGADSDTSGPRLFVVAAGNTNIGQPGFVFPDVNYTEVLEDPSQAWNALSVGAFTQRDYLDPEEFPGWEPMASVDDMSPFSTTALLWLAEDGRAPRPAKPDLVMEGGNAAADDTGFCSSIDSLSLLTTQSRERDGAHFTCTAMTSAATAVVSKMAAEIWAAYPDLRAETVRALLIHSARWTPQMEAHFDELATKKRERARHFLHCFGYGVPSLERAVASAESATTLVIEDKIQPYVRERNDRNHLTVRANHMRLHTLPWPEIALSTIAEADAELRITLSYFVEPNPARRGEEDRYSYPSHLLRFHVAKPGESLQEFKSRINEKERAAHPQFTGGGDPDDWRLWAEAERGSVHSDWWTGSAANLLGRRYVAVTPGTGWWKTYTSLWRWDAVANYSLVISLETSVKANLHTEIAQQLGVEAAPLVELSVEVGS